MDDDDVILTHAAPSQRHRPLTWNVAAPSPSGGGGSLLRTPFHEGETLDFDPPDEAESLPETEATPAGRKRRRRRATASAGGGAKKTTRRRRGGGGVAKRKKGRKRRGGGGGGGARKRPKAYHVRKGKVRVYSSAVGATRVFSAGKLLSTISPGVIESAANRVYQGRRRRRKA